MKVFEALGLIHSKLKNKNKKCLTHKYCILLLLFASWFSKTRKSASGTGTISEDEEEEEKEEGEEIDRNTAEGHMDVCLAIGYDVLS